MILDKKKNMHLRRFLTQSKENVKKKVLKKVSGVPQGSMPGPLKLFCTVCIIDPTKCRCKNTFKASILKTNKQNFLHRDVHNNLNIMV